MAVVSEGGAPDALFVLLDGGAHVTKRAAADREHLLADLGPGDYFGEIGVLEGIPGTATVTTTAARRLYRLGADDLLDALTTLPPGSWCSTSPERALRRRGLAAGTFRALAPGADDAAAAAGEHSRPRRSP